MNVNIREVPSRRVAYLRAFGRYPETFPKLWPEFIQLARALGLLGERHAALLSIMHDDMDAKPPEQTRGDAAVEVGADWQPQGGLKVQVIPAGLYAVAKHRGPYERLRFSWGDLLKWIKSNSYVRGAPPSFEIYENDPAKVAPADLITTLYLPVKKAS